MSDPLRTDGSRALDAATEADREAKIEHLLLSGLDCYFAAQYEQAINIWTRALFIDRGHARARAYIERARRALAERQRQAEELLQNGIVALDGGQHAEARRLLLAAIDCGAPVEQAHQALRRLDRQPPIAGPDERGISISDGTPASELIAGHGSARSPGRFATADAAPRGRRRTTLMAAAMLVLAALTVALYSTAAPDRLNWRSFFSLQEAPIPATAVAPDRELPRPERGELALARGRALAASGRLHDALAALEQVRATDPQKPEADRLRGALQRRLLELVRAAESSENERGTGRDPRP